MMNGPWYRVRDEMIAKGGATGNEEPGDDWVFESEDR